MPLRLGLRAEPVGPGLEDKQAGSSAGGTAIHLWLPALTVFHLLTGTRNHKSGKQSRCLTGGGTNGFGFKNNSSSSHYSKSSPISSVNKDTVVLLPMSQCSD